MNQLTARRDRWAPAVPYFAVLVGLQIMGSAWIAALLYHAWILLHLRGRKDWRSAPVTGWNAAIGVPLILVCATSGPLLYVLWPAAGLEGGDLGATVAGLGLSGTWLWVFCLYFSTAGAVLEELFWRGSLAAGSSSPRWGDAAFAGYHALVLVFFIKPVWIAIIVLVLFATGWIWRIVASRTGGLAIPIASHIVADLSVAAALFLLLRS